MEGGQLFEYANKVRGRRAIVDTGSPFNFEKQEVECELKGKQDSRLNCVSASGDKMEMRKQGVLRYTFADIMGGKGGEGGTIDMESEVHTSKSLPVPLFSFEKMYSSGDWDFLMRSEERGGPSFIKYGEGGDKVSEIPLQYDPENKCTWVEYGIGNGKKEQLHQNKQKYQKVSYSNLLQCVNVLPPLYIILKQLSSSDLVQCLTQVNHVRVSDEVNTGGVKRGLRSHLKKMTLREFHDAHGHLGPYGGGGGCEICDRKRGNKLSHRAPDRTPHKDSRPGYRWYLDAICWNEVSREGDRYTFCMRDACTGLFKTFNVGARSDFYEEFRQWVIEVRKSAYVQYEYVCVSEVHTDFDGVFREDNKEFRDMVGGLGVHFSYLPPEHHEGPGERMVGVLEEATKAMLLERNLPATHWGECVKAAEFLLNRYALSEDSPSSDGDAPRPLERFTGGKYSRRRIDGELGYYLGPGTLALVHDNRVKGSHLSAKTRFGVACGMEGDVVLFRCPYNGLKFRSKSYTVIHLPNYINFYQFLSLPEPTTKNTNSHLRPKHMKIMVEEKAILSHLPTQRAWEGDRLKDIKFFDRINYDEGKEENQESGFEGREYVLKGDPTLYNGIDKGEGEEGGLPKGGIPNSNPTSQNTTHKKRYRESEAYSLELKPGSLPQSDYEMKGKQYVGRMVIKKFKKLTCRGVIVGNDIDVENGNEIWEVEYEDGDVEDFNHDELMKYLLPNVEDECPMAGWINSEVEKGDTPQRGGAVNIPPSKITKQGYTTTGKENFMEVCRRIGLTKQHFRTYYDILDKDLKAAFMFPFMKGRKKADKLKPGIAFPHYKQMRGYDEALSVFYKMHELPNPISLIRKAIYDIQGEACQRKGVEGGREIRVMFVDKKDGKVIAPERVQDAYDMDDLELWIECWDEEMGKLENAGHITHGHTRAELVKMGITSPPISTRMLSAAKYKGHTFDKRKGRMIVQGFKQIPNVHYDGKVFTPAPSQYTQKILMALKAGKDMHVKSWDVGQAYTHGERVKPLAMHYPVGFKRRGENGEELYMIAHRQHYGEKGAGRGWGITRTSKIKEMYNTDNFSCHVCSSDPCLNVVVKWGKEGKPKGIKDIKIKGISPENISRGGGGGD